MIDDEASYLDRDIKYSKIIHCEVNALLFAGRPIPDGSILYTSPFASCDRCIVVMLQAGLRKFVAPKLPDHLIERWGASVERTRKYIEECGGELLEV